MQTATQSSEDSFAHHFADVGEVRLHYVEAGPKDGPLVVFLHGFPEFWWSWRKQLAALAEAGFRAVAPDLRGYNLSDKPHGARSYSVSLLAGDVRGLVTALGREKAHVVGHDWGGGVAWSFAMLHPQLLDRLAILNCPHPATMLKGLRRPAQLRKSWYMFFFQLPRLPEGLLARDNFRFLRSVLAADGLTPEEIEPYVEAFSRRGVATAAINYYRAMMRDAARGRLPSFRTVERPVLVIWGERDRFLGKELAAPDPKWAPDVRIERIPKGTHWVQNDAASDVNRLLIEFFRPG